MVTDTRTLTYDNVGRPITLDDNRHDLGFDYNALGNLTDFTAAGSAPLTSQDYTYDENANRETLVQNSTTYTYSLGVNNNRLTSTTGPTAKTYTYDAAGNVTSDNIHDYAYDDRGRLTDVDSGTVTYAHNGQGQRVKKDDGTVTLFAYDEAGQLLGEYDSLGNAIQEHVWFDGAPVAVLTGTDEYYVHTDHLGTPRIVTDGNTAIWRWESNPFGENAAQEDPDGDLTTFTYNLRFPGQYYDDETGLHYNYFRTYDPETGRYLESDPIGLGGGLNTYGYVNANPNSFVDPYGLFMTSVDAACTVDPFICAEVMGDISRIPQNLADAHGICIDATNIDDFYQVVENTPGLSELAALTVTLAAVRKGKPPMKRVGRHMSPEELAKMRKTGRVQEGGGGQTRVADPANPNTYRNPPKRDVYVEFDVPAHRVLPHSRGTGRIPGPNSPDARVPGRNPADFEMPPAINIKVFGRN